MKPLGARQTHFWLLQGMIRRSGADAATAFDDGTLTSADWANLVETCRGCQAPCACQSFLAQPDTIQRDPPAYCENAQTLAGLPRATEKETVE